MGYEESSKPMEKINGRTVVGGSFPADIWREYMKEALKDKPVKDFNAPKDELVDVEVCTESGLLPTFWCPKETLGFMIFEKGKEPTEICNIHNKVPVPDVMGLNIDEARQIFTDLNFVINESYEFNDIYNENIVFGVDPAPGTILESLTGEQLSVTLQISKGPQTYEMPDLIGLKKDMAEQMLSSLGITIANVIYDFSIEQPVDRIYKQDPPAAAIITKNTDVTIYISKGEDPEGTIPNVVGMTEVDALAALNNAGFKNVSVQKEESDKEIDKVFAQIPDSGTKYTKISEIIIKISRGILVPDVTGKKKQMQFLHSSHWGL